MIELLVALTLVNNLYLYGPPQLPCPDGYDKPGSILKCATLHYYSHVAGTGTHWVRLTPQTLSTNFDYTVVMDGCVVKNPTSQP